MWHTCMLRLQADISCMLHDSLYRPRCLYQCPVCWANDRVVLTYRRVPAVANHSNNSNSSSCYI
jgi:hypothetical protein